jgi:predicted secreted hydrolase
LALCAILVIAAWLWWEGRSEAVEGVPPAIRIPDSERASDFARASEIRTFDFPIDHGPHFDFQTEWWYFTGNVEDSGGDHFGYQLTFFRRGFSKGQTSRASSFATNQVFFAHFAITDVEGKSHQAWERYSRGADGLAGASGDPFRVWLEDWTLEALDAEGTTVRLRAQEDGLGLDLILKSLKPIVAHGEQGLSAKSEEWGNASYYLSYTRLATEGTLLIDGRRVLVRGLSWFDHEWSTSALGERAVGWDWFGLQMSDNRELMMYLIRNDDGSIDEVSAGTLVEPDGTVIQLGQDQFQIQILDRWKSENSQGDYPSEWRITVSEYGVDILVEPWLEDQEMDISIIYWEGAVTLHGFSRGQEVEGRGYVELTGYAESLSGLF